MTTEPGFDRQLQGLLVNVLDREIGPDATWIEAPAARRVADPRRRATVSRWPIRSLAVAAVLVVGGAVVGAALLAEWTDPSKHRPVNGWVAFTASAGTPTGADERDVYLVREGQAPRRIVGTDVDTLDQVCPAFSPNGTRLAYGQGPVVGQRDVRDVTLVIADLAADGSVTRTVETPVGRSLQAPCPTWSPDGRRLAFSVPIAPVSDPGGSADGSDVWIVSVDDGRITVLPDLLPSDLKWSPDGTDLAIATGFDTLSRRTQPRDTSLRIYSVANGELRVLGVRGVERITWSPDGTRIAYQLGKMPGQVELWVSDRDGSGARRLMDGFEVNHGTGPAWSPNGDRIAYQRVCAGCREGHDLVIVDPDTAAEVVLPITVERDGGDGSGLTPVRLTWSPDGTSLLAVCWGGGVPELAIVVVPIEPTDSPRIMYQGVGISAYDTDAMLPIQSWGRQPDR